MRLPGSRWQAAHCMAEALYQWHLITPAFTHNHSLCFNPFPILVLTDRTRSSVGPRIARFASGDRPRGTVDR